jgi:GMP synthase-like glutamine amidotransferase
MKPKVLGIQFRKNHKSIEHEQMCIIRALQDSATCAFVNALDDTVDWVNPLSLLADVDGIVLGGSGDYDFDGNRPTDDPDRQMSGFILNRLTPMFEYIFNHDIPTFGICYGHQLLGAFAGVRVWNDPTQKKSRSHEVHLLANMHDHFLFTDVPKVLSAFYGHKDSLETIPDGATLIMEGGPECRVSALQYQNNIFTTQFHPELTFSDMVNRLKESPDYLPEGVTIEEVYKNDSSSNQILINFGKLVKKHAQNKDAGLQN